MSTENKTIHNDDVDEIAALLVGRSVRKVADDRLTLDDGTELQIIPNVGGCSCGAGDYELDYLAESANAITAAEVVVEDGNSENEYDEITEYRIFVYAEGVRTELARISGDDGNGYYGTGFAITVTRPVKDREGGVDDSLPSGWVAAIKAEALRDAARDTRVRGDIGKEGGVEAWDYLHARADRLLQLEGGADESEIMFKRNHKAVEEEIKRGWRW